MRKLPMNKHLFNRWSPYDQDTSEVFEEQLSKGGLTMPNTSTSDSHFEDGETERESLWENGFVEKEKDDDALRKWLAHQGLEFNPFQVHDAGQDNHIPYYIIHPEASEKIKDLHISYVFAPAGGGKSAFRVHLAHKCRSNENDRRIFPVVYRPFETQAVGWQALAQAAAQDLFIFLLYHLVLMDRLGVENLRLIKQHLEWNLPGPLDLYIEQLRSSKSLDPVIDAFDPTARMLPRPPSSEDILRFCDHMNEICCSEPEPPNPQDKFDSIVDFVFTVIGARAIFLLIDGADAFYETSKNDETTFRYIQWLFDHEDELAQRKIYAKYFLPEGLKREIENQMPQLLKNLTKAIMIKWNKDSLIRVIQERLLVASRGRVKNLDAISTPELRGAEQVIVQNSEPYPRSVILLTEHLLRQHVETSGPKGLLKPSDLEAVINRTVSQKKKQSANASQGAANQISGGSSGGEGNVDASTIY